MPVFGPQSVTKADRWKERRDRGEKERGEKFNT